MLSSSIPSQPGRSQPASPSSTRADQQARRTPPLAQPPSPSSPHARPRVRQRNPRVLAALCYAVPIVPGWVLLARERRNAFVRFHAAQSLVFFLVVAVGQLGIYAALVLAGGRITNDRTATIAAAIIAGLYLIFAAVTTFLWLRMVADCMRGAARPLPLAGGLGIRLERLSARHLNRRA
jgi:uncharacterized membrane protein